MKMSQEFDMVASDGEKTGDRVRDRHQRNHRANPDDVSYIMVKLPNPGSMQM